MDLNMVKYLAELSKLEYSDKELAATAAQMTISRTIMMFTSTI